MNPIRYAYGHVADKLISNSTQSSQINPKNVFQDANTLNRDIINREIISELMHSESNILNVSQLLELGRLAQEGHSCLIVMEHYSNFDVPNLLYLLEIQQKRPEIARSIVAIAGMKLNAESNFVRAFTEAYTRIVIYPSRSLTHFIGTDDFAREQTRSWEINKAALQSMIHHKHNGKIILIFPTGTRYRQGIPETKRGLAEVDSYIRGFDYFLPIAVAGNILRINVNGDMSEDYVHKDCVILNAGNIIEAKKWRHDAHSLAHEYPDTRQYVADCIMELLSELHVEANKHRRDILATSSQ